MSSPRLLILRSNPVQPDPRVEKEARVLAEIGAVTILAWDRTGQLPKEEKAEYASIRRARIKAGYGGLHILGGLVRFNLWLLQNLLFGQYDAVHACDLDTGFAAYLATRLRRKKLVYDIFDMYSEANSEALPPIVNRLAWRMERRVVNAADCTIIVDENRRRQLKGMRPKKVIVVYNSPEEFATDSGQSSTQSAPHQVEVFYCGVLARNRGFDYLIEAIATLPSVHLTIAGYGPDEAYIKEKAAAYPQQVSFLGRIPYAEAMRRSAESDILFALYDPVVKNHQLSSPNKLFESMMLARPVIVSKGTGMSDLVEQIGNGIVVTYGSTTELQNAIHTLSSLKQRQVMGEKGRQAYDRTYSWQKMAASLGQAYQDLLG